MASWIFLAVVSWLGSARLERVPERCDVVELNVVRCPLSGDVTIRQLIFWDWAPDYSALHVRGWALVDENGPLTRRSGSRWIVTYQSENKRYNVSAGAYRATQTTYDREMLARKLSGR